MQVERPQHIADTLIEFNLLKSIVISVKTSKKIKLLERDVATAVFYYFITYCQMQHYNKNINCFF